MNLCRCKAATHPPRASILQRQGRTRTGAAVKIGAANQQQSVPGEMCRDSVAYGLEVNSTRRLLASLPDRCGLYMTLRQKPICPLISLRIE